MHIFSFTANKKILFCSPSNSRHSQLSFFFSLTFYHINLSQSWAVFRKRSERTEPERATPPFPLSLYDKRLYGEREKMDSP